MNAPVYDPADPATRDDPFPLFARLREEDPAHWSPRLKAWILTRYDDVKRAHFADEFSPDRITPFYRKLPEADRNVLAELVHYLNLWLVFRDPPEHTRLRKLLNVGFTPAAIRELEPMVKATVGRLLDDLEPARGTDVDMVARFASPLPALVIMSMLGVPHSMLAEVKGWSDEMQLFIGGAQDVPDKYARAREGAHRMAAYFRTLIAERRAAPSDDILSRLIAARDEDDALSDDELIASSMLMLFGGHETTTNLIASSVHLLCRHPDAARRLRADPALVERALEEVMRFDGPSNSSARIVAHDHELAGRTLKAGQRVFAMIAAANRDPAEFQDPDVFDIDRPQNRHLTFGVGRHFCLGSNLARLEGRIAVEALLERFPDLSIAAGQKPERLDAIIMRGFRRLPVHLGAGRG